VIDVGYRFVEKSFRTQLQALGWNVIDQDEDIPEDLVACHRTEFREVVLKDVFKQSVSKINLTNYGREWINDKQLCDLFNGLTNQSSNILLEANMDMLSRFYKSTVDMNEVMGEDYPVVKIINCENWQNHHFIAIDQFRIDTRNQ